MFFQDEGRFGRINNLRYCWSPKGVRAIVKRQIIREFTYAYTAVCPETGENLSLISPLVNTEFMSIFLEELGNYYSQYRIILAVDKAGWHTSKKLKIPENIRLLFLPPYSPELNPVELIWKHLRKEYFNNRYFNDMDKLEEKLTIALNDIFYAKDVIKSITNLHWLSS